MENYNKILIVVIVFNLLINLQAVEEENKDDKKSFAFYPFGAYSSDKSVFLGGYALYRYRPSGIPENAPPSSLELNLIASFKKQLRVLLRNKFVFAKGKYAVGIPLRYYNWPTTYYGIGWQQEPEKKENYTREYWEFFPYIEYHLWKNYIITVSAYFENDKIIDSEADNELLDIKIDGFEDYFIAGPELRLERLTTDEEYYPRNGSHYSINLKYYDDIFGSDYNFSKISIDLRKYLSLGESQTLAGQMYLESADRDIPFEELPDLGSNMRGFEDNKYINYRYLLIRVEDRIFPFRSGKFKRFGFAVFGESGQTFDAFEDMETGNQKYSAGMGIRWIILPKDMLTLRFDLAFSRDGFEMEIISFEAF